MEYTLNPLFYYFVHEATVLKIYFFVMSLIFFSLYLLNYLGSRSRPLLMIFRIYIFPSSGIQIINSRHFICF